MARTGPGCTCGCQELVDGVDDAEEAEVEKGSTGRGAHASGGSAVPEAAPTAAPAPAPPSSGKAT
ncbi:hypothetical protein GCM10028802_10520 [Terrabacter terrigena]